MLDSDDIELLFDALPDAILLCSGDGRIRFCNRQLPDLLGYSRSELQDQPVEVLVPQPLRARHALLLQGYAATPRLRGMNQLRGIMALHRDGHEVPVTVSLNPVPLPGPPFIIVCLREDRAGTRPTATGSAGPDLQPQRLESLGLLSCTIAHDIRNLLTVVNGHAELLLGGLPRQHHLHDNARAIISAAAHLQQLSQQILSFAGNREEPREPVQLSRLVQEMTGLLAVALPHAIKLERTLAEDLPPVSAAPSQLAQIVLNLVMNARDAIGQRRGSIRIDTGTVRLDAHSTCADRVLMPRGEGLHVWLRISDDGHGMPESVRTRVFDPFYSTRSGGKGLGLALVHDIVSRLGGAICLDSHAGLGTSFTIYLPADSECSTDVAATLPCAAPAIAGRAGV